MRPPVRLDFLAVAIASFIMFTGLLGWGHGDRSRKVSIPARAPQVAGTQIRSPLLGTKGPQPGSQVVGAGSAAKRAEVTHVVQPGDTLLSIARIYRVDLVTVREANQLSSDQILEGQRLVIPGAGPLRRHTVQQGDTLWEIATQYGVSIEELLQANRTVNPGHLQIGHVLVLPSKSAPLPRVLNAPEERVALSGQFAWPVVAPVSSPFGPRWGRNHAGVDLAAHQGDPIRAARSGKVLLAGTVPGYGFTVVLQHQDGTRTLYAHCSILHVRAGQQVQQGQLIAQVGSTGVSTGPHLHFEIIVNDRPRDPLLYLPKGLAR